MIFKKQSAKPKDLSPNSLEIPKADTRKNGTKYISIIVVIVLFMVGILYYSLTNSGQPKPKEVEPPTLETENKPLMPASEGGQGLAFVPEPKPLVTDEELPVGEIRINVVNPNAEDRDTEALRREQEEIRRMKVPRGQAALGAPILISRKAATMQSDTSQPVGGQTTSENNGTFNSDFNSAAAMDQEAFFERADNTKRDGWISPYTREQGRPFELKTGLFQILCKLQIA